MRSSILTILSLSTLSLAARHEHNRLLQHRDLVERQASGPNCGILDLEPCSTTSTSTHATPPTTSSSPTSTPTTSVKTSAPTSSTKSVATSSSASKIVTSSSSSSVVRTTQQTSSSVASTTSSTSSVVTTSSSSSSTLSSSSSTLPSSSSVTSKTSIVSKPSTIIVAPSSAATRTVGTADSDTGTSNSTTGALPTGTSNVDASKSKSFLANTGAAVPVFIILALVAIGALYGVYRYLRRQRRLRDEAEAAAYFDSMGQQDEYGAAEEKGHPDYFSEDGDHMYQVQPAPMGTYTNSELHYGPGMTAEDFYGVPPPPAGVYNPTGALALESYSGPQHQHQPMQQQQQYGGYATDYPADYLPTDGVAPVSTPGGPAVQAQPYHMNAPTITITPDFPPTHQF